jgi:mono/diheme cytochrome c family protein
MRALQNKFQNILKLAIAVGLSFSLTACGPSGNKPNVELIQDMMESPANKPQEYDDFFKDHTSARVPPEHTVPVGFKPYKYGTNFEAANKENKNPLAGDESPETMMIGQKHYETQCMACHGMTGKGDGPVGNKMSLKPPSLISDKIKGWSDGGIYHVIAMGQGTMGPYASAIPQAQRWQLVNYIRQMQKNSKVAAQ